jgi:tetratricopeptide (TPR) repeat protein
MDQGALALAAHRDARIDDALAHYGQYLAEQPQSGGGWLALGILLQTKLQAPELALHCFRAALHLMPDSSQVHFHMGTALCELDQQRSAIVHLERHLAAEPSPGGMVYADLACAHARLGNFPAAEDVALRFREAAPDEHFPPYLAAWISALQGRMRTALSHATDSVALAPFWPQPLALRGLLLSLLGERELASRVLQEMVALFAGLVSTATPREEYVAAAALWRQVRAEAKACLGLRACEPAHFILLPPGLGDAAQTAGMLGAFRQANASLPLVVLCARSPDWQILYPDAADLFVHLSPREIQQLAICNKFFPDHPYMNYFTFCGPLLNLATSQQLLRFQLGLPQHVQGAAPSVPATVRAQSLALFERLGGKPGRSVLVAPISNSNPMASLAWWQGLADRLHAAGFMVFQNVSNSGEAASPPALSHAVPVQMPIEHVLPFCEAGGHFIGVRSGMCDLLGHAGLRMKAIHVTRRYGKPDSFPLSLWLDSASGFGLRRSYRSPHWQDYDIRPDSAFDPAVIADWLDAAP